MAIVYQWLQEFLVERLASLEYRWGRGRKSKLSAGQQRRLCQLLDTGPEACGFSCACWSSVLVAQLIQRVIQREFNVLSNRFSVCTWLKNLVEEPGLLLSKSPICLRPPRSTEAYRLVAGGVAPLVTASQAA